MKVLFDFGAIKSGGGAQLSLNFLEQLLTLDDCNEKIAIVVPEVGPIAESILLRSFTHVLISPDSYAKRLVFEYGQIPTAIRKLGIRKVFTFFGAGLPTPDDVESIVQVAYPIICYPDSLFWSHLSGMSAFRIRALNRLRIHRLKRASRIIAETAVMQRRLCRVLGTTPDLIEVLPPAPSQYVSPINHREQSRVHKFLFVSGNSPHKNLWRLYAVAERLRHLGFDDFVFVLTVTRASYVRTLKETTIASAILTTHFQFLGSVRPQEIMTAYEQADVVCSLSDLESFTNNYMEAWTVGLPLIVSDRDFAHCICGDSALYVEPHNPADVAEKFFSLARDPNIRRSLMTSGRTKLNRLPTQAVRFQKILQLLEVI